MGGTIMRTFLSISVRVGDMLDFSVISGICLKEKGSIRQGERRSGTGNQERRENCREGQLKL